MKNKDKYDLTKISYYVFNGYISVVQEGFLVAKFETEKSIQQTIAKWLESETEDILKSVKKNDN